MNLPLPTFEPLDYEVIHEHLVSYKPPFRNMHLREACQRNKKRVLRQLHAIFAVPGSAMIEGMISGPEVLFRYQITATGRHTQFSFIAGRGTAQVLSRIAERLRDNIMARIRME
nr:hypothetical protein [Polyangiaceae bacterium]